MEYVKRTGEIAREDFENMKIAKGLESFTASQYRAYASQLEDIINKADNYDDLSKSDQDNLEVLQTEISGMNRHVVLDWDEVEGCIVKSVEYTRLQQVEWEEGEEFNKGIYKDTPENRKIGRVGQKYGGKKKQEDKSEDNKK